MAIMSKRGALERHATLLLVCCLLVVTVGGIVEIAPLFYLQNTVEKVQGVRPYSTLELKGRQVYIAKAAMSATAR